MVSSITTTPSDHEIAKKALIAMLTRFSIAKEGLISIAMEGSPLIMVYAAEEVMVADMAEQFVEKYMTPQPVAPSLN